MKIIYQYLQERKVTKEHFDNYIKEMNGAAGYTYLDRDAIATLSFESLPLSLVTDILTPFQYMIAIHVRCQDSLSANFAGLLHELIECQHKAIYEKGVSGLSSLHLAALYNDKELVKLLIQANVPNDKGNRFGLHAENLTKDNAIHQLLQEYSGSTESIDELNNDLTGKANISSNRPDVTYRDILEVVKGGDIDSFSKIISTETFEKIASVYDNNGNGVLHYIAQYNQKDMFSILMKQPWFGQFDINSKNAFGETMVHIAAYHDIPEVLGVLEALPSADFNVKNNDGLTPISIAMQSGKLNAFTLLLRSWKIDVNADIGGGQSLLFNLTKRDDMNEDMLCKLLYSKKVDVNKQDSHKNTAIFAACKNANFFTIFSLAYPKKVDLAARNAEGKDVLEYLLGGPNPGCAKYLFSTGAVDSYKPYASLNGQNAESLLKSNSPYYKGSGNDTLYLTAHQMVKGAVHQHSTIVYEGNDDGEACQVANIFLEIMKKNYCINEAEKRVSDAISYVKRIEGSLKDMFPSSNIVVNKLLAYFKDNSAHIAETIEHYKTFYAEASHISPEKVLYQDYYAFERPSSSEVGFEDYCI